MSTEQALRSQHTVMDFMPPHSLEAEQAILGELLVSNSHFEDAQERLNPEAFYHYPHQCVFRAMIELAHDGQPLDIVTVANQLERNGHQELGGQAFLTQIASNTSSTANVPAYIDIVIEHQRRRTLVNIGRDLSEQAFNGVQQSSSLIMATEQKLFGLAESKSSPIVDIRAPLQSAIDSINKAGDGILTGVPTGFDELDRDTGGWQKADFIVLAGRPSMGKTALAMNFVESALTATANSTSPVFIFSLEMPAEQLMLRMLASLGKLSLSDLRAGNLDDADWQRVEAASQRLLSMESRLKIDDSSGSSATTLHNKARRMMRLYGKPLFIMIDYVQLLNEPGAENRNNEISAISRILKAMAKELNCPVIALSQLNRSLESRPNKRPVLADLRDSGAIEQDADIILFIYRDEVYNNNTKYPGVAELILGKQRNGPLGTIYLGFIARETRFESMAYGGAS